MAELSVVILSFNTKDLTLECLRSIFTKKWEINLEVWVVDNNSSDGTCEAVKVMFPQVKLIENPINSGFAKGNNLALRKIKTEYTLLLNSDTQVLPHSLDEMVKFAKTNGFSVVSCKIKNGDGSFQPNAGQLPSFIPVILWLSGIDDILKKFFPVFSYQATDARYYRGREEVGWVSGSVMLIKRDVLDKVGYLDENIFMYGEDVEFCLRAKKAGFRIGWTKDAEIIHLGGGSSRLPKFSQWAGEFRGLLYIYRKYYGFAAFLILRFLIYIFIIARAISFLILGRGNFAKTYGKVLINI